MFRSLPGRRCWHFCVNCPAWPWSGYDEVDDPPQARWCKTCVRLYVAGTGDLEDPPFVLGEPTSVFNALCTAFSAGELDLRQRG